MGFFYCLHSKGSRDRVSWFARLTKACSMPQGDSWLCLHWFLPFGSSPPLSHIEKQLAGRQLWIFGRGSKHRGMLNSTWHEEVQKNRSTNAHSSRENTSSSDLRTNTIYWCCSENSLVQLIISSPYLSVKAFNFLTNKVISTPPIPCTAPLHHKSASLQFALGASPFTAVSR